jgi:hypothetical protein
MKTLRLLPVILLAVSLAGCTVVSANRTFPKLSWYWSADARRQRADNAADRERSADVCKPPPSEEFSPLPPAR